MRAFLFVLSVVFIAITGTSKAQILYPADSDFETPAYPTNSIQTAPSDTAWTFSTPFADSTDSPNQAGITSGTGQNVMNADGQVAYLQDVSSISQELTLSAGTYVVALDWEGRTPVSYIGEHGQSVTTGQDEITITLNGVQIFYGTPSNTSTFETVMSSALTLSSAGTYDLVISGISSGVATNTFMDKMSFIDNVNLDQVGTPEPSTWALLALGGVVLFRLSRRSLIRR